MPVTGTIPELENIYTFTDYFRDSRSHCRVETPEASKAFQMMGMLSSCNMANPAGGGGGGQWGFGDNELVGVTMLHSQTHVCSSSRPEDAACHLCTADLVDHACLVDWH